MAHVFSPPPPTNGSLEPQTTPLPGVFYLPHQRFTDHRGFYAELSRLPELDAVLPEPFQPKQINLSRSQTHVIRGFHAENWSKLLMVISGTAFCAFADFRPESPSFGQVMTATVGDEGLPGCFFLSPGIGNSFLVTQGPVNYLYAVDELYQNRDTSGDVAISLFDPDLAVDWPLDRGLMILSDRDQNAITLREKFTQHLPAEGKAL